MKVMAFLTAIVLMVALFSGCGGAGEPTVTHSSVETTTTEASAATVSTPASTSNTTSSSARKTKNTTTVTTTTTTTVSSTSTTTTTVLENPPTTAAKVLGAEWYKTADWNEDGVLKILAIGNSFSEDALYYVCDVAVNAGICEVQWGNLHIGGCKLETHLKNAKQDSPSYTYYKTINGNKQKTTEYKLSDAVKDENWDFITFQQASLYSGEADSYDYLEELMNLVAPLCTNPKVEFAWHMTWAYQKGYSGLLNYGNSQRKMYDAIVSAVQSKIVPNERISKIIPSGTAIQNTRTSYIGDELTRDGMHLAAKGKLIAAMTYVHTLVGIDWNGFDYNFRNFNAHEVEKIFAESVENAKGTPLAITKSHH